MSRLAALAAALALLATTAHAAVLWQESTTDLDYASLNHVRGYNPVNADLYAAGRLAGMSRFYFPENYDTLSGSATYFYLIDSRLPAGGDGFILIMVKEPTNAALYTVYHGLANLDGGWSIAYAANGGTPITLSPGWHTTSFFWDGTAGYCYIDGQLVYTDSSGTYSGGAMAAGSVAASPFLGRRALTNEGHFYGELQHVIIADEFADVGMTEAPGVASFTPVVAPLQVEQQSVGAFGDGLHRRAASSINAALHGSFTVRATFRISAHPTNTGVGAFGDAPESCGGRAVLLDTRADDSRSGNAHGCYLQLDYCSCCSTPGYELRGVCADSGAGVEVAAFSDPSALAELSLGVQYDLALEVDRAVSTARLYLDGAQVGTNVAVGAGTVVDQTGSPAMLGADKDGNSPFTGSIDLLVHTDEPDVAAALAIEPDCAAPPGEPTLVLARSGLEDGDLVAAFETELGRYTSTGWRFVGATAGACGDDDSSGQNGWTHSDGACAREHTLRVPATAALKECGFSAAPEDGGSVWYYEAVVEATTEEAGEDVFGQPTTVTKTTAFRVRVELPKSVDVSASAVAYGAVIQFALLSQQEVDTSTPTAAFKWTLVTSVQYPYELTAKEVTEESGHVFESLGLSLSAASVACPATGACTQTFEIAATESTSCELTDAELKSVFTIGCRSQFTGSCDTPEGVETDTATFTVSTDSFCARVVEVATVTPTLTTSTSQGGASAADFVLQTTLFGRVTFAIEAGLSVTSTRLLSLDLVSEESVKPVTGAGVQDSAVVSAISFVESDQGGTAPHLDFQFQLNTESVKFAVGGGQASLTITAVVEVTYDGAGSQQFVVQAVSGPGSVSTAASGTVGVSTPAAGGSSTTAGSTVLGVSTGTAMVAGVGLVAVVALAAGAAVVARKRRVSSARRLKPASSSVELNDTAAIQV